MLTAAVGTFVVKNISTRKGELHDRRDIFGGRMTL
jgi:hypothetical protein